MLIDLDRPLQHINKKGRPISQCPHCRGLRKSRATHAACECGSKPHKQADHNDNMETKSDPGDPHKCCCTHGMRCTCALKKEPLNTVSEMNPPVPGPIKRTMSNKKPRLAKAGSDNTLTSFASHPHRSFHQHSESAHQSGVPFKVPIPHSVPGKAARRSTDSLPMLKRKASPYGSPEPDTMGSLTKARISKSEQGSPGPRNMDSMPPLDFNFSMDQIPQFDFSSAFYTPQEESSAMSGFNMSPPTEWPAFDAPQEDYAPYIQPNNPYSGYGQFSMTDSSSGDLSDNSGFLSQNASRPQLSAANSDDSSIKRSSPALFPNIPHNAPSLASQENLRGNLGSSSSLHNAVHNRAQNFSSEESLASRSSYPVMSQNISPVDQPFDPPSRPEHKEDSFLPPTSSPQNTQSEHFSPSPFAHNNPTIKSNTSLRPPTSSPKQTQDSIEQISPPNYNAPLTIHEETRFHPTEVSPADFSQPSQSFHREQPYYSGEPTSSAPPQANQLFHQGIQNEAAEANTSLFPQTNLSPQQRHPFSSPAFSPSPFSQAAQQSQPYQPPKLKPLASPQVSRHREQSMHPQEFSPADFARASPSNPAAGLFQRPKGLSVEEPQAVTRQRSSSRPQSSHEVVDQLQSPAVGGAPEDFTKHGLSVRDAQRLAHPESMEAVHGVSSPGGIEGRGISVHDAQRMAHQETPSSASSETSSVGNEARNDPFRRQAGLSVQDAQRLAHPTTPTEALSGLTIPQTTKPNTDSQETQNVWARGRAGSTGGDSATSYVSQQEVEGNSGWGTSR